MVAELKHLKVTPIGSTFVAQVDGLDFSKPIPPEVSAELLNELQIHGVLVARNTNIDDDTLIDLGKTWGELDSVAPHRKAGRAMRLGRDELFDVGNIGPDNKIVTSDPDRVSSARGNAQWHADSGYNPRRAGISIIRAVELPPKGAGGETEFIDSRKAYDDLSDEKKKQIEDYVGMNTILWNRHQANPDMDRFKVDFTKVPLAKHKISQIHEPTGRKNLYVHSYTHHIEGLSVEKGREIIDDLLKHMYQDKYKFAVHYENPGDVVFWDNTAVLHRATLGEYVGKYRRDMRRISTFDTSSYAWGLNSQELKQVGLS